MTASNQVANQGDVKKVLSHIAWVYLELVFTEYNVWISSPNNLSYQVNVIFAMYLDDKLS